MRRRSCLATEAHESSRRGSAAAGLWDEPGHGVHSSRNYSSPPNTTRGLMLGVARPQDWYGQWVTGIFLDETVEEADEVSEGDRGMCRKYKGYHNHIKDRFGRSALVSTQADSLGRLTSIEGLVASRSHFYSYGVFGARS